MHNLEFSFLRRRLDQKNERWLRFEIELASDSDDITVPWASEKNAGSIGAEEVLNLALYDQADPNNLYLCTVDRSKF